MISKLAMFLNVVFVNIVQNLDVRGQYKILPAKGIEGGTIGIRIIYGKALLA
jgi:hypothetical protein